MGKSQFKKKKLRNKKWKKHSIAAISRGNKKGMVKEEAWNFTYQNIFLIEKKE